MAAADPSTWIEGAGGAWRLGLCAPTPRLAGCVNALTCYGESWPGPVSRRQVATSGAVVFVTWGAPLEVLGRGSEALMDQLSGVSTPSRRLALVEAILAGGLGAGPRLSPEVVWAWRTLRAKPSAPVAELAAEIGWSRTRLASRFSEQVGISPKRFARVVRFEGARRLLAQGSSSLAEVATRAGYYDQAHLCRDVGVLAGCTPAELAGELGSGGPPDP